MCCERVSTRCTWGRAVDAWRDPCNISGQKTSEYSRDDRHSSNLRFANEPDEDAAAYSPGSFTALEYDSAEYFHSLCSSIEKIHWQFRLKNRYKESDKAVKKFSSYFAHVTKIPLMSDC